MDQPLPHRCPHCNALVVDRRSPVCTTCKAALPAEWVMSSDQTAKVAQLDRQARAQYDESKRILDPPINPDAPAVIRFLNQSSVPGTP